jgi:hypothetical protein
MSIVTNTNASDAPSTTILHRPFGGITGYRKLSDRASRVGVQAFPISMVQQLSAAGLLATPGTYVLTDNRTAYVGESIRPARRLSDEFEVTFLASLLDRAEDPGVPPDIGVLRGMGDGRPPYGKFGISEGVIVPGVPWRGRA